jgi:hypothetical protein
MFRSLSTIATILIALLLGAAFAPGQNIPATVTFELNFPGSEPPHYIISVAADCQASYQSDGRLSAQSDADDTFHLDFTVTQPACGRIFDLTRRAQYFNKEIDSKKKNLASTGAKTLSYKDSQKSTKASYNYSPNPDVQELTATFQAQAVILEFGRRLEFYHRFQKLALDEELKRMEESSGRNDLQEISAIKPVLQKIIDDRSLMNVVRARAQRLLVVAGQAPIPAAQK